MVQCWREDAGGHIKNSTQHFCVTSIIYYFVRYNLILFVTGEGGVESREDKASGVTSVTLAQMWAPGIMYAPPVFHNHPL